MTPEELDEARCKEAERIYCASFPKTHRMATIAARLAREGWQPPEPVDPDLLAAREWMASKVIAEPLKKTVLEGLYDHSSDIRAYLAGCTRGREGAKGLVAALDWYADPYNYMPPVSYSTSVPISHDCGKRAIDALASAKRGG